MRALRLIPPRVADAAFLVLAVAASALLYVPHLGFYSDDWPQLAAIVTSDSNDLQDLFASLSAEDPGVNDRPLHAAYLILSYKVFGLSPVGYHIIATAMLAAVAVAIYLVLAELRQPRVLAVSVPLVFTLLPHYSTARFWTATHQAMLSMFLMALAALFAVKAVGQRRTRFTLLVLLVFIAVFSSGLAYEIPLPLTALVVALAFGQSRLSARTDGRNSRRAAVVAAAASLGFMAVAAFKLLRTDRIGLAQSYPDHLQDLATSVLFVNFGVYGAALPYVLAWITRYAFDVSVFALTAAVGAGAFLYIRRVSVENRAPTEHCARLYIWFGVAAFALGYGTLVTPTHFSLSSHGLDNRISIASSLGLATLVVGLLAALTSRLGTRGRNIFAIGVGSIAACGFLIINTLGAFWGDASQAQQRIVTAMMKDLPSLPSNSVVILDGVCVQRGAGLVISGNRDVRGILSIQLDRRDLNGASIIMPPKTTAAGLQVFGMQRVTVFPYGRNLFVYDYPRRRVAHLTDRERARAYFSRSTFDQERDCPTFSWRGPPQLR